MDLSLRDFNLVRLPILEGVKAMLSDAGIIFRFSSVGYDDGGVVNKFLQHETGVTIDLRDDLHLLISGHGESLQMPLNDLWHGRSQEFVSTIKWMINNVPKAEYKDIRDFVQLPRENFQSFAGYAEAESFVRTMINLAVSNYAKSGVLAAHAADFDFGELSDKGFNQVLRRCWVLPEGQCMFPTRKLAEDLHKHLSKKANSSADPLVIQIVSCK